MLAYILYFTVIPIVFNKCGLNSEMDICIHVSVDEEQKIYKPY